jgi:hypothetical protein
LGGGLEVLTLGTAFPYRCNDNINNVGHLTSPQTNNVNVMGLFPNNKRRRHNGHRSYNRPIIHDVTLMSLLPYITKPLGPHHIRTKLHFVPLRVLYTLFEQAEASPYLDFSTPEYRLNSMIMDVAHHRLFKPPPINDNNPETCHQFLKLKFSNKGIDVVNLSNILPHKKVQSCIPEFFKSKFTPCISYKYTPTVASKLFNYKPTLQCIDIEHHLQNPLTCSCSSSPSNYQPAGHVITGDVNIVRNEELKSLILKGPKF